MSNDFKFIIFWIFVFIIVNVFLANIYMKETIEKKIKIMYLIANIFVINEMMFIILFTVPLEINRDFVNLVVLFIVTFNVLTIVLLVILFIRGMFTKRYEAPLVLIFNIFCLSFFSIVGAGALVGLQEIVLNKY